MRISSLLVAAVFLQLWTGAVLRADLVVEENGQILEPDYVNTRVVNHGLIAGKASENFVFGPASLVSGSGSFDYVTSWGIFAPGNSPGVVSTTNYALGGTLQIELGGTDGPGFGDTNHDQINDSGTITFLPGAKLEILSFNNFVPEVGDTFDILTWQTELVGGPIANVLLDATFTINNISFKQLIANSTGAGKLTLVAIPEPNAFLFLCMAAGLAIAGVELSRANGRSRNTQNV